MGWDPANLLVVNARKCHMCHNLLYCRMLGCDTNIAPPPPPPHPPRASCGDLSPCEISALALQ